MEEDALVAYLLYMADRGFPLTRTMVKAFAWTLAKWSGNGDRFNAETGPGEHWWTHFKSFHPEITLRMWDMLERTHAEALNQVTVNEYLTLLSKTLDDSGLKNKPRQLYNGDKTFLPLNCIQEKAVPRRGTKNVYCQSYGTREHTVLRCFAVLLLLEYPIHQ